MPIFLVLRATLWSVMIALCLATVYQAYGLIRPFWLIPGIINTALTLGLFFHKPTRNLFLGQYLRLGPARYFIPSAIILSLCLLAIYLSRLHGTVPTTKSSPWNPYLLATVFWIPIVEESIFRVLIGGYFRRYLGGLMIGSYFSAVTFALCHAMPKIADIMSFTIAVPIGTFFLGLACEALLIKSGSLWPPTVLHGTCNLTGILFLNFDSRWLHWLKPLYL